MHWIACISEKLHYYRQRTKSIMSNAYSIKQLDIIEAYIQRERYFLKNGNIRLAQKTLMRAIIFLEWFSIGMEQEAAILKRYSDLKLKVCNECENILKRNGMFIFRIEYQLYQRGMLPYKMFRSLFWKITNMLHHSK